MTAWYRAAFRALCAIGHPFGGVRPRRIYHWLARRAYPPGSAVPESFRWYRDRWGHEFLLHPFYFLDRHIIAFGAYDPGLLRFLAARLEPGMVCLDIGANLGEVCVHMASRVGPTGHVHAFEPIPHINRRLREHVKRNGIEAVVSCHDVAIADKNGTITMTYASDVVDNQGMGSIAVQDHPDLSLKREVRTQRLDDFVEEQGIDRIDYMKIDIQGAEPLLLAGASRTLERFGPELLIEVAPVDLKALGYTSRDLLRLLENHGYHLFEISHGKITRPLSAARTPVDFETDNVYATKAPPTRVDQGPAPR